MKNNSKQKDIVNIYNASEPIINKSDYKDRRLKSRSMNRIMNYVEEDIPGPAMMAIDKAIKRSSKNNILKMRSNNGI